MKGERMNHRSKPDFTPDFTLGFKLAAVFAVLSAIAFGQSPGKTRTYYIAADEVEWDYAPGGVNKMMGMKFDGYSKVSPNADRTASELSIARLSIANIPTKHSRTSSPPCGVGAHRHSRPDPAGRGRRHSSHCLQKQRNPPLQHAPAWCFLRQRLRGSALRRRHIRT